MNRPRRLFAEALASIRSQPVVSLMIFFLTSCSLVAVLLTAGRTLGAEAQLVANLESVDTRAVSARLQAGSTIDSTVVEQLGAAHHVEWVGAFSAAFDVRNAAIASGIAIPARYVHTNDPSYLGLPADGRTHGSEGFATADAAAALGLTEGVGLVSEQSGRTVSVAGSIPVPSFMAQFEPVVLMPVKDEHPSSVALIVIVADSASQVGPLATFVRDTLAAAGAEGLDVRTSEAIVEFGRMVSGQVGIFARTLMIGAILVQSAVMAMVLSGLVTLRRRDFGRRRALGATRGFIVALLLCQICILTLSAVVVAVVIGYAVLALSGDPVPDGSFILAMAILSVGIAVIACLVPALAASRRDPIRELRVP